ncbi:MAG: NADH-quinone oxidoreductase subunit NuoG [Alphaproteobacteria bacterium]
MPKLKIDGNEVEVPAGTTILQAAEAAGVEIPRFCYHDRLQIAGNCRMCLVEVEKSPKPVASCAMPAGDGMVVHTRSPMATKARNGVMEFLLIHHPLDCPICDQGGECDLQDQAMAYGFDRGRYREAKRAVREKYMGPLVKTVMTRCIHCTRCIRFATEIAGVEELGAVHRGEHMEITTYLERAISSELSGNVIDLCPVGALTSGPYAFTARPWELKKTESIDVMDAVGSNIRIDTRGAEVMRVLPRLNEAINEEWIADKTRFACDGLRRQRLDRPYVRRDGKLRPASWAEAFAAIRERFEDRPGARVAAIAGDLADSEAMYALKTLMTALGSPHLDCRQDGARLEPLRRASYLFNTTIAGIEAADACLLVGTNPRHEAPIINARLRKRSLRGGFAVGAIGPEVDLTYRTTWLGDSPRVLEDISTGRHAFGETFKAAKNPMLILGAGALARGDGARILGLARRVAESAGLVREGWNGFNVLHRAAARVGGLDLGFVPQPGGRDLAGILDGAGQGDIDIVYLLGADEIDMNRLGRAFVIYQGHHGDRGAHRADVILPGAAYTEKDATYVNTEGRVQRAQLATFPPGDAREDWKILRALSDALGHRLPFDTIEALRRHMVEAHPVFASLDTAGTASWGPFGEDGPVDPTPFTYPIGNFYMTDPISRSSETMARCTAEIGQGQGRKTGTHG